MCVANGGYRRFRRGRIELPRWRNRIYSGGEDSMNTLRSLRNRDGYSLFGQLQTAGIVLLSLLSLAALPLRAQDKKESSDKDQNGAGLIVSAKATAKEVGLPIYPGARPHKDEGEKSSDLKMGLWAS